MTLTFRPESQAGNPSASVSASASGVVQVSEVRDYHRINAEVVRHLDAGQRHVRLAGVEGQRLLLSGLHGDWDAVVEVDGSSGPELAAGLDAPRLRIIARGFSADGAGRELRAGHLLLHNGAGDALAAGQTGGTVLSCGPIGHRAGLRQAAGVLVLLGPSGRLLGDRQSGGRIYADSNRIGPFAGRGRTGGALLPLPRPESLNTMLQGEDLKILMDAVQEFYPWLPEDWAQLFPATS